MAHQGWSILHSYDSTECNEHLNYYTQPSAASNAGVCILAWAPISSLVYVAWEVVEAHLAKARSPSWAEMFTQGHASHSLTCLVAFAQGSWCLLLRTPSSC